MLFKKRHQRELNAQLAMDATIEAIIQAEIEERLGAAEDCACTWCYKCPEHKVDDSE